MPVCIVRCWIVLRMRNVSQRICKENQNTHFVYNKIFFRKSCRLWDNVEKYGKTGHVSDDSIIWRILFACRMTKARTQKHIQNILIIITCPQQAWLWERALVLRSTYIVCFVWPCTTQYNCVNLVALRWWRHSVSTNHCGPRSGVASSKQFASFDCYAPIANSFVTFCKN
jgi:hypothetical protein